MVLLESIVAILAGLVAVCIAVVQVVSWWHKRRIQARGESPRFLKGGSAVQPAPRKPLPAPTGLPQQIAPLVRMAYVLLRLDRLPAVGNWGFTINKYIELNYPDDPDILARKDSYMREGSITHTAHALRGIGFLRVAIPGIEPDLIRRWVDLNSTEVGLVAPVLPANPDEVRGLAKEIRHTSTATLSLLRLKPHLTSEASIDEVERWVVARSRLLLGFAGVWVHDPRMTYSHAYLLELFDILRHDSTYASEKEQLDRQISHGLHELFKIVSIRSPYWCSDSHPETKIFYSILILSRILMLPELTGQTGWADKVCACLEDIGRTARAVDGVPLGFGPAGSRFTTSDLGTTAAFLECCQRAYMLGFPVKDLVLQSCKWMERSLHVLEETTRNAITHTWESVLSLLDTISVGECFDLPGFCNQVEPFLWDITKALNRGERFPDKAVEQLGSITGYTKQLRLCFERDIWQSALKRRDLMRSGG